MLKMIAGIVVGAAIGFAVGYFGKCTAGACPLTGNPIVSTILGALLGGMIMAGR